MNPPSMTTLAIVEDDHGTRESLAALLANTSFRLVGSYGSAEEALAELPARKPEIAVVDINLAERGMNGIELVSRLKHRMPLLRVMMLTRHSDTDMIFKALKAGACGYVLKKTIPLELLPAIEQLAAGGAPMSMQIAREVVEFFHKVKEPASDLEKLSKREQEVLALLAKGYLYKEIADMLGITLDTVRVHAKHIYEKLHVHSRTAAALKYLGNE